MELDLRHLLHIARRRWWIVTLLMLLAGVAAYVVSSRQDDMYSATATIRVNAPGLSTDANAVRTSQDLTETYRQLIVLPPVLDQVIADLSLPYSTTELAAKVTATNVRDTQLVRIAVSDPDPALAATIANSVASTFAAYVADESRAQIATTLEGLQDQTSALSTQISDLDQEIAKLDTDANRDDAAIQRQIDDMRNQRTRLQDQMADLETQGQAAGLATASAQTQVTVTAQAAEPTTPYAPRVLFSTVLGLFVGFLLAVAVVAGAEFLDNTVKPDSNIQEWTGAPVLATVTSLPKLEPGGRQVYTLTQSRSGASEAIRLLRTNLEFAAASAPIDAVTITSAGPGEGKSTTVANLGVVLAQGGQTVAILDADLRRPTQHRIFGVRNETGLTTLLTHPDQSWQSAARRVALPGLYLLPSGPVPPNPSDLLSSDRFEKILERIKAEVDLVIIDSPPILAASDALAIANHTDGVVLVTQSHRTRVDALRHSAQAVQQGGIRLVGVVLNRQKAREGGMYYGEYYSATAPAGTD